MDYDAHAIDPTKGKPEADVPKRPVRPEAKVLYTDSKHVSINIKVETTVTAEEDVSGAIRTARLAELSDDVPDAFVKQALVNTPVIYASAEEAAEDATVMKAIAASKDFAEAVGYLSRVKSPLARKTVNTLMVAAINRAIRCELGLGIGITDFEEDGAAIIPAVQEHGGALMAEKLRAAQRNLLASNILVTPADDMREYANATLATGEAEELSEAVIGRVLFLQRNVSTVWVNFTDDELAIGKIPERRAATISPDSLGALYEIARSVFTDVIGDQLVSEQYLVTKDNVVYRLHRGLINRDCFLLSQQAK